jgi:hypothetical protein
LGRVNWACVFNEVAIMKIKGIRNRNKKIVVKPVTRIAGMDFIIFGFRTAVSITRSPKARVILSSHDGAIQGSSREPGYLSDA